MQHLGAESGHLGCFDKADFGNGAGAGDEARIRGVDAGHIGPDLDTGGIERFGEQGCAVVRAAAPQRGGAAIAIGTDKALGDDEAVAKLRAQRLLAEGSGGGQIDGGLAKAAVGAHQLAHILPVGLDAALAQQLGKEAGRHQLAAGDEAIGQLRIGMLVGLLGHEANFVQLAMNEGAHINGVAEIGQNGLLDPGQFGQLLVAARFVQLPLCQSDQQVGDTGAGAQYHHPGGGIGQHDVGAVIHGREVGDTGSAKLGDIDRAHCLLLSYFKIPVPSGKKERRRLKMAGMNEAIPARSTPPAEPIPYRP